MRRGQRDKIGPRRLGLHPYLTKQASAYEWCSPAYVGDLPVVALCLQAGLWLRLSERHYEAVLDRRRRLQLYLVQLSKLENRLLLHQLHEQRANIHKVKLGLVLDQAKLGVSHADEAVRGKQVLEAWMGQEASSSRDEQTTNKVIDQLEKKSDPSHEQKPIEARWNTNRGERIESNPPPLSRRTLMAVLLDFSTQLPNTIEFANGHAGFVRAEH